MASPKASTSRKTADAEFTPTRTSLGRHSDGISPSLRELATLAQALGVENFGDLNGVEGGAFAEVVAAHEQG